MGTEKSSISDQVGALHTEAVLKTILDGIGEGFYAVDRDWRIVIFNNEASLHFGRPPEDMLGLFLWDALPGARETGLGRLFVKTMATRETVRNEEESVVFPGRWMAYRLFPLADGMGVVFRDISDRRKAEAQRDLLVGELEHRIKNTISIVLSIASQTFGPSDIGAAARQAFEARLVALANVHGVLTKHSWDSADLQEVVMMAIRPHIAPGRARFTVEGPMLRLGPKSAVSLSMAVHELCTNAIKYGALSAENGGIDITWTVERGRFHWRWRERGGSMVSPPARAGFGSRMIERVLAAQLSGDVTIEYAPSGLTCVIDAPQDTLEDS